MRHPSVIEISVRQLVCTSCGAEANASCNCGKPYVPAKRRAAEAIAANPQKSDRAIAVDLGVSRETVRQARSGDNSLSPEREGRDGKVYRLAERREQSPADEAEESLLTLVDISTRITDIDLSLITPTEEIRSAVRRIINVWIEAERKLK